MTSKLLAVAAVLFLAQQVSPAVFNYYITKNDAKFFAGETFVIEYYPEIGYPPSNTSYTAEQLERSVLFRNLLPGVTYEFFIYVKDDKTGDFFRFGKTVPTTPEGPRNLELIRSRRQRDKVLAMWRAPKSGISNYRLHLTHVSEPEKGTQLFDVPKSEFSHELTLVPYNRYLLSIFVIYEGRESAYYQQANFTMTPHPAFAEADAQFIDDEITTSTTTPKPFEFV